MDKVHCKRVIACPSQLGTVLLQPNALDAEIPGNTPHWDVPHKHRDGHDKDMRAKQQLDRGFEGFYASASETVARIGDTSKRHLTRSDGAEYYRKLCFKLVPVGKPNLHATGKKEVEPFQGRPKGEEFDDVPRGKKHLELQKSELAAEMPMFQLKHQVRDPSTGKAVSQRRGQDKSMDGESSGKHIVPENVSLRRNEVTRATSGDKLYAAAEYSLEYQASLASTRPRLGVDKIASKTVFVDHWAERDAAERLSKDVTEVRNLPKYPKPVQKGDVRKGDLPPVGASNSNASGKAEPKTKK